MTTCLPFDRPAPRGQPPLSDWTQHSEHLKAAISLGLLDGPNYLRKEWYSAATVPFPWATALEVRVFEDVIVGTHGALMSPTAGAFTPEIFQHQPTFTAPTASLQRAVNLKQIHDMAFYHFVVELLPRLLVWEDDGATPLLIGTRPLPEFSYQYLELLGFPRDRVVWEPSVKVKELLWPNYYPWVPGWAYPREPLLNLRDRLRPAVKPGGRRVALVAARSGPNAFRELVNLEDVAYRIRAAGYEVFGVRFGELPVRQQIEIASQAELLVGAFGGDMTNMVWLRDGAAVVDIHCGGIQPYLCHWHVAACLGHSYFTLFTGPDRVVDPAALDKILGEL